MDVGCWPGVLDGIWGSAKLPGCTDPIGAGGITPPIALHSVVHASYAPPVCRGRCDTRPTPVRGLRLLPGDAATSAAGLMYTTFVGRAEELDRTGGDGCFVVDALFLDTDVLREDAAGRDAVLVAVFVGRTAPLFASRPPVAVTLTVLVGRVALLGFDADVVAFAFDVDVDFDLDVDVDVDVDLDVALDAALDVDTDFAVFFLSRLWGTSAAAGCFVFAWGCIWDDIHLGTNKKPRCGYSASIYFSHKCIHSAEAPQE